MYEFKRLRDEKVPQGELEEAKCSIVSNFALSLENPAGLVNSWLTVKYFGLGNDYWTAIQMRSPRWMPIPSSVLQKNM